MDWMTLFYKHSQTLFPVRVDHQYAHLQLRNIPITAKYNWFSPKRKSWYDSRSELTVKAGALNTNGHVVEL